MKRFTLRIVFLLALIFALTAVLPALTFAETDSDALPQTLIHSNNIFGDGNSSSFGVSSESADNGIDTSTADQGYITVKYSDGTSAKMKVGISFNGGAWTYIDYKMGKSLTCNLSGGSGSYTVALFKKTGGSYVTVTQRTFTAYTGSSLFGSTLPTGSLTSGSGTQVTSKYPEYLTSAREISFSSNDSISRKAASLCKDKNTDQKKILAIYNYIAKNFKYDYSFADKVRSGQIRTYTPTPSSILSNKKGVCYDFSSLFAAMCRSQGIPCKLVKGYSTKVNGYHAWNSVYDSATDKWYVIDLTIAVCKSNRTASKFSKCYMSSSAYTAKSSV